MCASNGVCAEEGIVQRLGNELYSYKGNGYLDIICVFYYFALFIKHRGDVLIIPECKEEPP